MSVNGRGTKPLQLAADGKGGESLEGSYFVSTYPPFSTWREDDVGAVDEVLRSPEPTPSAMKSA